MYSPLGIFQLFLGPFGGVDLLSVSCRQVIDGFLMLNDLSIFDLEAFGQLLAPLIRSIQPRCIGCSLFFVLLASAYLLIVVFVGGAYNLIQ